MQVLVGDAAHASSPMMGQGGCMAMEDACVLAEELRAAVTLVSAVSRPGIVTSRNALMDEPTGTNCLSDDRTIDSHVKRLRKKFRATENVTSI
jgi:hypothetical protein